MANTTTTSFRFDDEDRRKLEALQQVLRDELRPGCRTVSLIDVVRVAIDEAYDRRFSKVRKEKKSHRNA